MILINGRAEGFETPSLRKISTEKFPKLQAQTLILKNLDNASRFNKILSNSSNSEVFRFHSKSVTLTDGDLVYIQSKSTAVKIYDATSSKNALFLTEECNCNCLSCPQPPNKNDTQPWIDIALQIIKLIDSPPDCLGITGGEPTLKWDGLLQILETCSDCLPNTSIQLLSNGLLLCDFNKVLELKKANSKVLLGIPLYSDVDEIHDAMMGRKGAFWETMTALHNLERSGICVELRIVVSKVNYNRLPQLSEFIYRNLPFVSYVAFMALEPIGKADKNIDHLWISPADYQTQLVRAVEHLWRRGITPLLFNYQLCLLAESLRPLSVKAISDWKVRFVEECDFCSEKSRCGGIFFSALPYFSTGLKAIRK